MNNAAPGMLKSAALQGPTAIRGVGNWRVKETERMLAICTELRKLGAEVEEGTPGPVVCSTRRQLTS